MTVNLSINIEFNYRVNYDSYLRINCDCGQQFVGDILWLDLISSLIVLVKTVLFDGCPERTLNTYQSSSKTILWYH